MQALEEKSGKLVKFSDKVVVTSKLVATGNTTGNKKVSEAILSTAGQIESLTPQLVNAGEFKIKLRILYLGRNVYCIYLDRFKLPEYVSIYI